jgi:hypothetical protein
VASFKQAFPTIPELWEIQSHSMRDKQGMGHRHEQEFLLIGGIALLRCLERAFVFVHAIQERPAHLGYAWLSHK